MGVVYREDLYVLRHYCVIFIQVGVCDDGAMKLANREAGLLYTLHGRVCFSARGGVLSPDALPAVCVL